MITLGDTIPEVNQKGFLYSTGSFCYVQFKGFVSEQMTFLVLSGKFPFKRGQLLKFSTWSTQVSFGNGRRLHKATVDRMVKAGDQYLQDLLNKEKS